MTDSLLPRPGAVPFEARHLGPDAGQQAKMLATIGYGSLDELTDAAVPAGIRQTEALDLPAARSETEALADLPPSAARDALTSLTRFVVERTR